MKSDDKTKNLHQTIPPEQPLKRQAEVADRVRKLSPMRQDRLLGYLTVLAGETTEDTDSE